MPFDSQSLTDAVSQCYAYARANDRFTPEQRQTFLFEGNRLRGQLLSLISKEFEEGTPELNAANEALRTVTDRLGRETEVINGYVETVNMLTRTVEALDGLLKLVTSVT